MVDSDALSPQVRDWLADAGLPIADVVRIITTALEEDLDGGIDVTSAATVPADQTAVMDLVSRRDGTVAGVPVAAAAFEIIAGGGILLEPHCRDGDRVRAGTAILSVTGPTRALLTAERTALNLIGHLSGVATATAAWVDALAGTGAVVRDTRKTTPGLRRLEKYAVRCGGGQNHRMSLSDAALIKDNHIAAAGGVTAAFAAVRAAWPGLPVEVEVDSLAQLAEVVDAGADLVLLDNFSIDDMRRAVLITGGRARLEASGGLALADAAAVGRTGVDYVAVGALTHSAPVLDIGADFREVTDAAGH